MNIWFAQAFVLFVIPFIAGLIWVTYRYWKGTR